jgi:hypothetical protein
VVFERLFQGFDAEVRRQAVVRHGIRTPLSG